MTTSSSAKAPTKPNTPGPEYRRLDVFVGRWNMEGEQHAGLIGPAAKVSALQNYEWLNGGLFLVHRFEGHVGESEVACLEIIGYDPSTQSYPTHAFYNNGIVNEWQSREQDGVWTLTGDWQLQDKSIQVRCTTAFSDGGETMKGKWEYLDDNSKWQLFWDVKAIKER